MINTRAVFPHPPPYSMSQRRSPSAADVLANASATLQQVADVLVTLNATIAGKLLTETPPVITSHMCQDSLLSCPPSYKIIMPIVNLPLFPAKLAAKLSPSMRLKLLWYPHLLKLRLKLPSFRIQMHAILYLAAGTLESTPPSE